MAIDENKVRYTHRDYQSIKQDLLDAVPSLTKEWTAKEDSDPGVVLIKLMSMFGDTLSYNMDKNVLELFFDSVTQRKNCAKILRLLGYKMHWYRSARVIAHVSLSQVASNTPGSNSILLTPYVSQFKTSSNSNAITYTVTNQGNLGLDDQIIINSTNETEVKLIEGTAVTQNNITFNDQNRYYFPDRNIDESEIILTTNNSVRCQLVSNLASVTFSDDVIYYEFNIDEYNLPYIEVSANYKDISNSFDALRFKLIYIKSSGSQGNIDADVLMYLNNSSVVVHNESSTLLTSDSDYNSAGQNPQTVDEGKEDASKYIFTHDTLVTPSDFEKACDRIYGITMSKLVDNLVIEQDRLDVDELADRAEDNFARNGSSLANYLAVLYLGYQNFDPDYNEYYASTAMTNAGYYCTDLFGIKTRIRKEEVYNTEYTGLIDPEDPSAGYYHYYPYKLSDVIREVVSADLKGLNILTSQINYGTVKVFPFRVNGVVHLSQPLSPSDCVKLKDAIDKSLYDYYYPGVHNVGERPNIIEIVNAVQSTDEHIKYFDAADNNQVVEWAKAIVTDPTSDDYIDKIFDTTSAVIYNGLSESFKLGNKFMTFRLKNILSETAYLVNYSAASNQYTVLQIPSNSSVLIQCKTFAEIQAISDDMTLNKSVRCLMVPIPGSTIQNSLTIDDPGQDFTNETYTPPQSIRIPEDNALLSLSIPDIDSSRLILSNITCNGTVITAGTGQTPTLSEYLAIVCDTVNQTARLGSSRTLMFNFTIDSGSASTSSITVDYSYAPLQPLANNVDASSIPGDTYPGNLSVNNTGLRWEGNF